MSAADDYLSSLLKGAVPKTPRRPRVALPSDTTPSEESTPEAKELPEAEPSVWSHTCEISEKLAKYLNLNPWIDLEDSTPQDKCPELFHFKDLETPAYAAGAFQRNRGDGVAVAEDLEHGAAEEWWVGNVNSEDQYYFEQPSYCFPSEDSINQAKILAVSKVPKERAKTGSRHLNGNKGSSGAGSSMPGKLDLRGTSVPTLDQVSPDEKTPRFLREISSHVLKSGGGRSSSSVNVPNEFCSPESLRTLASSIYVVSRRLCPACTPNGVSLPPSSGAARSDVFESPAAARSVSLSSSAASSSSTTAATAVPSSGGVFGCSGVGANASLQDYLDTLCWSEFQYCREPSPSPSPSVRHPTSLNFLNATLALLLFIHRLQKMETQRRLTNRLAGSPSGCASSSVWKQQKKSVTLPTALCILIASICFLTTVQKNDHIIDQDSKNKRHSCATIGGCCTCPGFAALPLKNAKPTQSRAATAGATNNRRRVVENAKKLITSNSALVKMVGRPSTSSSAREQAPKSCNLGPTTCVPSSHTATSPSDLSHGDRAITFPIPVQHIHELSSVNSARELAMSAPIETKNLPRHPKQRAPKHNLLTRILSDVKSTSTKALLLPIASKLHGETADQRRHASDVSVKSALSEPVDPDELAVEILIRDCAAVVEIIRRFCSAVFIASAWVDELEPISSAVLGEFLGSAHVVLSSSQRCRRYPPPHVIRSASVFPMPHITTEIANNGGAGGSESFGVVRSRAVQLKRIAAVTASTLSGGCMNSDSVDLVESPSCLICRGPPACLSQHSRHPTMCTTSVESQVKKALGLTPCDFERLTFSLLSYIQYDLRIDPMDFWFNARILLQLIHRFGTATASSRSPQCPSPLIIMPSSRDTATLNDTCHSGCECSNCTNKPAALVSCGFSLKPVVSGSSSVLTSTSCNSVSTTVPASLSGLRTHSMPFSSSFASSWVQDDPF